MNEYLKKFLHRGLIFGGFGPIIMAIIYAVLDETIEGFSHSGSETALAVISLYALALIQAGASGFNQIEHWSTARSTLVHFLTLYAAYVGCYLANTWIPFEPMVIVIFSAIFLVGYFVIWLSVYLAVKATERRLNAKIKR